MEDPATMHLNATLAATSAGDRKAAAELLPLVYAELRALARARLARLPPGNTLQPTALVHDVFMRLIGTRDPGWNSKGHFFAAAAEAMRQALVDQARRKNRVKRGGGKKRIDLEEFDVPLAQPVEDILALDEALERLNADDPRKAQIVSLRYFAGLNREETAAALDLSLATVDREWRYIVARLHKELTQLGNAMNSDDASDRYRRVESLYQQAADLPPDRRAGFLAERCVSDPRLHAEVDSLLQHHRAAPQGFLETPAHSLLPQTAVAVPERIGRYEIIRLIGRGGMGAVYEAQQPQPKRRVALKVIRADSLSEDALRRFRFEAEVLGRLRHPGIAQIYEFGVGALWYNGIPAHEQPFFAMELVRGLPLAQFVATRSADTRATLSLMAAVCDAVHHAHQKGVIHRDLKPGNIVVDEDGQPKVLDFGVARVAHGSGPGDSTHTGAGQLLGTVPYMSPEQLRGDPHTIDTRCDVYALGVVAYELLTGRLPYDITNFGPAQAIRILSEREPMPARAIRPELRGDIDAILARAMDRDPERRYAAAGELAADIRRFLGGEPIDARRGHTWYVTRRLLARHRTGVAVAASFLLLLAASAIALGVLYGRQAALLTQVQDERDAAETAQRAEESARQAAQQHAVTAGRVVDFLEGALVAGNPLEGRSAATVRDLLDWAAADIAAGQLSAEPEAEMVIRRTIGTSYRSQGRLNEAQEHLEEALSLAERLSGKESPDAAIVRTSLGEVRRGQGRLDEAAQLFREARRIASLDPGSPAAQARATTSLALLLASRGEFAEATSLRREALELGRSSLMHDPVMLAGILHDLAMSLDEAGQFDQAESLARESLALLREELGEEHPRVAVAWAKLAGTLQAAGRFTEAEPIFREQLERFRRTLGESHPEVARTLNNLGTIAFGHGRHADAADLFEQALAMRRKALGDSHEDTAHSLNTLGQARRELKELDRAEAAHREALTIRRNRFGPAHPQVATSLRNLADVLALKRDYASADPLMLEAISIRRGLAGAADPLLARDLATYAFSLKNRGEFAAAEPLYLEALEIRRKVLDADHPDLATSLNGLGEMLRAQARFAEALPLLREAADIRRARLPERRFDFAGTAFSLGATLNGLEEYTDAEAPLREALAIVGEIKGAGDAGTMRATIELCVALAGQRRCDVARGLMNPALEAFCSNPEASRPSLRAEWLRLAARFRESGLPDEADELERRVDGRERSP